MNKIPAIVFLGSILCTSHAQSAMVVDLPNDAKLSFGGYFKLDMRHVNGDLAYRDFWISNNGPAPDTEETRLNIRESRFNIHYDQGDLKGTLEWDFYDDQQPVGVTESVTGGHSLRLRHAFVKYQGWLLGQTWSTFMPLASIPEALDFGGPHVAQTFIRQSQIRYTLDGLELALENPSTLSGESQTIPDAVARYTLKDSWGQIGVAALVRNLDDSNEDGGADGLQLGYNLHGRIKSFGKDDFRFSYNGGAQGRYTGPGANIADTADADGDILDTQAYTVAYRHFWTNTLRSSIYYGNIEIDDTNVDRSHWALNLLQDIKPGFTVGGEFGNYETESGDSDYLQFSAKYSF